MMPPNEKDTADRPGSASRHNDSAEQALLEDIQRYFDCELSDEEEHRLLQRIAVADFSHPLLNEARAVMGFSTLRHHPRSTNDSAHAPANRRSWRRIGWIAAAVAVVAVSITAISVSLTQSPTEDKCFAYVNGKRIVQEEAVLDILYENMRELDEGILEAEDDITTDLELLAPTAMSFDSEFDPLL